MSTNYIFLLFWGFRPFSSFRTENLLLLQLFSVRVISKSISCFLKCFPLGLSFNIALPLGSNRMSDGDIFLQIASTFTKRKQRSTEETRRYVLRENETPFPPKHLLKRHPSLTTRAADHSWISCHSALTTIDTFDGVCVCTCVLISGSDTEPWTPNTKAHYYYYLFRTAVLYFCLTNTWA